MSTPSTTTTMSFTLREVQELLTSVDANLEILWGILKDDDDPTVFHDIQGSITHLTKLEERLRSQLDESGLNFK